LKIYRASLNKGTIDLSLLKYPGFPALNGLCAHAHQWSILLRDAGFVLSANPGPPQKHSDTFLSLSTIG